MNNQNLINENLMTIFGKNVINENLMTILGKSIIGENVFNNLVLILKYHREKTLIPLFIKEQTGMCKIVQPVEETFFLQVKSDWDNEIKKNINAEQVKKNLLGLIAGNLGFDNSLMNELNTYLVNNNDNTVDPLCYNNFHLVIKLLLSSSKFNIEKIKLLSNVSSIQKISIISQLALIGVESITNKYIYQVLNDFSLQNELDKVIPDSLGSLKNYYLQVVKVYYEKLHPIVWFQIYEKIIENLKTLDIFNLNSETIIQFLARIILLNSGPFMLKILQLITPLMDEKTAERYNIKKLTYPLIPSNEVEMLLNSAIGQSWKNKYTITTNISASVGHVCFVKNLQKYNDEEFVIKIIKPISLVQSCWESKILRNVFNKKTNQCEFEYIDGVLTSNSNEMNSHDEIKNINYGFKKYNHKTLLKKYNKTYKLTTIKVIENIINPKCKFALAMTMAKGIGLNKLIEENKLNYDTPFRSSLHRCFDILIYKFFKNLIANGFYHGDLHAGNILYSHVNNQITLIDFGAVSKLDIGNLGSDKSFFIKIIMCILYENYDDLFDTLTDYVNSKCTYMNLIEKNTKEYILFKSSMSEHKKESALYYLNNPNVKNKYKEYLFSDERYQKENSNDDNFIINDDKLNYPPNNILFVDVISKITEFYSKMGVNIVVKLGEYFNFQKAYLLLNNVSKKINYDPVRFSIMLEKGVKSIKNFYNKPELVMSSINIFKAEKNKYNKYVSDLKTSKMKKYKLKKIN